MDADSRVPLAPSRYRVQALAKGLQVLDAFVAEGPVLSLSQVAVLTGLPMPTAFRLVATFEEAGYVERLESGALRLGHRASALAHAAVEASDLADAAGGPLRALADATGQTVNLASLSGTDVLYLQRLKNTDLVTANIRVGSTLPAVYSSLGKVLLAFLDPADVATRLLGWPFDRPPGPGAVTSLKQFAVQLDRVRRDGYATQDQEIAAGLRSIAAPVCGGDGRVVAAINIACTVSDWSLADMIVEFEAPLLSAAREVSVRLGC